MAIGTPAKGRGSFGAIVSAAASALSASEGALLASLAKGPNYYDPDRHPDRSRERLAQQPDHARVPAKNDLHETGLIVATVDRQAGGWVAPAGCVDTT